MVDGSLNVYSHFDFTVSTKGTSYDSEIPFLGIYSMEIVMYINTHEQKYLNWYS